MDSALIVFTKSPYGHINIIEGARVAQGLLLLDKNVACAFTDEAVISLLKNQDPSGIGVSPVKLALMYLVSSGVEFYALEDSLNERGLNKSILDEEYNVKIINIDELAVIQDKFDTVLFF